MNALQPEQAPQVEPFSGQGQRLVDSSLGFSDVVAEIPTSSQQRFDPRTLQVI